MGKETLTAAHGDMEFLSGTGEMAGLIRATDWSDTPLGPVEAWPQSLRTVVSLCLASNFPINIIWGPKHIQIYNDGYRVVCGDKHPTALGMDYTECWASAWPAVGEPFDRALAGETSFLENQRMFLFRNGYLEETFFTFSTSPIRDETGGVGGLFHPVTETTATMLGARRTQAVRDLTARLGEARTSTEVVQFAAEILAGSAFDLPFVLLYLLDGAASAYRLAAQTGLAADTAASPLVLPLEFISPWPAAELVRTGSAAQIEGLPAKLEGAPCGPYDEPPELALALPISQPGTDLPVALLIAGASSRLPLDEAYRGFYDLVAAALGAALAKVRAQEEERRRAEALAAVDRAKTAFFSNVSHEFRTPLTLMLGPVEDALREASSLSATQKEGLEIAHRNALRLLKLVNSLLDFSRIEAGRTQASYAPTDLAALTVDLASNFRSACERAGLALHVDCPPLPEPVHVDRDMWEKIVLNLLSNAFKFTLEGGITVDLQADGCVARLCVSDTGVGIPEHELPRVFERFHRIEGQRGRTHEGTGIGLALVDELVRLHGGTIDVESGPGQGSTFRVSVPFGAAHLPANRDRYDRMLAPTAVQANVFVEEALRWLPDGASHEPAGEVWLETGAGTAAVEGRPRVVLADDNTDMRGYVARILEAGGYDVEAVADGEAALAAARCGPMPDLVLTDVMMPKLDGFGLLRALRADPAMEGVLVVLLSARAGEEARVEGLAAGADDYLVKPFSARELRARIDGAVSLARQRREAAIRERDLRAELATERSRAALRETEKRLEFALKAGRLGAWEVDLASGRLTASEIHRTDFGLDPADAFDTYDEVIARVHPEDRARQQAAVAQAIAQRSDLDVEHRVICPNGKVIWVMVRGQATYDEDGTPLRLVGVSLNITERKGAEERQRLLLDELNHRVKNTLATVQSIAVQTLRTAGSPAAFGKDLEARVAALARAHDLLTQASWDGALLSDVVDQTLAPYAANGRGLGRVDIAGPRVRLGPNAAVTLNMAFHELATNAAKYGALSQRGGNVAVRWAIDRTNGHDAIDIVWSERGGPPVAQPSRRGFGSRLIEQGLVRELDGDVRLTFAPDGVCCRMHLPVSAKIGLAN